MQYEMDIQILNKELNQTKDDERKKTEELEKHMVSLNFFSRKISNLYAIKKEVFNLLWSNIKLLTLSFSIIKTQMTQYEKDIQTLKEALAENKEDERKKNEELEKNTVTFHFIVHSINKY